MYTSLCKVQIKKKNFLLLALEPIKGPNRLPGITVIHSFWCQVRRSAKACLDILHLAQRGDWVTALASSWHLFCDGDFESFR